MRIATIQLENNLILAPMQNVTTAPYRRFSRKFNTIGLVCVPMIYTKRIEKNSKSILIDLYKIEEERPISVQLIGGDINALRKSIDFLSSYNFDFLDINAGCPSKRAIRAQEGGYLLKNLEKLQDILDVAIKFSSKPVTVKIRTGFSSSKNLIDIIKVIESSGVDLITIHSRTVKDRYDDSKFDIESLKLLKENVLIPVIGNGDIFTPQKAKEVMDYTKVDGLMIGRASMGNPKIFTHIASVLQDMSYLPIENNLERMRKHLLFYEDIIDEIDYSAFSFNNKTIDQIKFSELKRNAIWFTRHIKDSKKIRLKISNSRSLEELKNNLKEIYSN